VFHSSWPPLICSNARTVIFDEGIESMQSKIASPGTST
jgi:hypothetical protein